MKFVLNVAALLLAGWTSFALGAAGDEDNFSRSVPLCTVIRNAKEFDGQTLLVQVLYRMEPHGPILIGGPACPKEMAGLIKVAGYSERERARLVLDKLLARDEFKPVDVVYRATFHIVHGFSCTEVNCFLYEIRATELLAARPYSEKIGHTE